MLCDDLEGWRVGGEEVPEGGDILLLIHVNIQWRPLQHCKAIILQLKKMTDSISYDRK